MERLVDEHDDFKVDSLPHRQPVKLPHHRRDVLSSTSSSDQCQPVENNINITIT